MSIFVDVEQKIIICITESNNPEVRGFLLSNTTPEDFGDDHASMGRKRINTLLQNGKTVPDALTFSQDTVFEKGTRTFLAGTPLLREECKRYTVEKAQALVDRLKLARNKRAWEDTLTKVAEITEGSVDETQMEEIAQEVESTLVTVRDGFNRQPLIHMGARKSEMEAKEILNDLLHYEASRFVSTGIQELDKRIFGFERGNLVTISATRGGGKSTMAMIMGINQYLRRNHNVCFVSMEMTEREFWRRMLSNISEVEHDKIRSAQFQSEKEKKTVKRAWAKFWKHGQDNNCTFTLWPINESFFTPMKMEAALAPFMYDCIIVDYITLFHGAGMETWKMQMEYSRYLALMAKRLQCVVIVITQMNDDERVKYGSSVEENTDYWLNWLWRKDKEQALCKSEVRLSKARHTKPQSLLGEFHLDVMNIECSKFDGLVLPEDPGRGKGGRGKGKRGGGEGNRTPGIFTSGNSA